MAFANYTSQTLRASAATSGTSGQDTAVTLPESVSRMYVVLDKTAEANVDNVLSVRLQAQVDSFWVDIPWTWQQTTQSLTTAADVATDDTKEANIVDADSSATFTVSAYYNDVPSNVIRVIWIASGTTPAHTFSATAYYPLNRL